MFPPCTPNMHLTTNSTTSLVCRLHVQNTKYSDKDNFHTFYLLIHISISFSFMVPRYQFCLLTTTKLSKVQTLYERLYFRQGFHVGPYTNVMEVLKEIYESTKPQQRNILESLVFKRDNDNLLIQPTVSTYKVHNSSTTATKRTL